MSVCRVIVSVTKEHIKAGCKKHYKYCPIALALQEKFHKLKIRKNSTEKYFESYEITVGVQFFDFRGKLYNLSETCSNWIENYDRTGRGKPFKFCVKLPQKYIKTVQKRVKKLG